MFLGQFSSFRGSCLGSFQFLRVVFWAVLNFCGQFFSILGSFQVFAAVYWAVLNFLSSFVGICPVFWVVFLAVFNLSGQLLYFLSSSQVYWAIFWGSFQFSLSEERRVRAGWYGVRKTDKLGIQTPRLCR